MNQRIVIPKSHWRWPVILLMGILLTACKAGSGDGLDSNGRELNDIPDAPEDDAFAQVQAIFDARCTVCHAGASAPQGLVLTAGQSYDQLVGIASSQQSDVMRVLAGAPDDSYLIQKIRGDAGITGAQMPRNGPPFLSNEQVAIIVDWVASGAPPSQPQSPVTEYEADLSDFSQYKNWQAIDYSVGLTNPALAGLHGSDVEHMARRVFANATALDATDDEFPLGSILVKEVFSFNTGQKVFADEGGLLAMVKRGGDFNSDHGGWEWFMLANDASSIMARGSDLMNNGCNSCHQQAELDDDSRIGGRDYVFAHLSEFIADAETFSGYQSWSLIDERNDANPLLDNMAHGAMLEGSSRRVYKKQLYANADTVAQGYPVGTAFVKEVLHDGAIVEATAMVKRGGDFNANNGHWEWFMLQPETGAILADGSGNSQRGANLMDGMCSGCHFAANTTSGEGIDFVFKHSGDPFNNNEEFFAELSHFDDYTQWSLVDYTIGPINAAIGGGHQGQNNAFSRKIYANNQALNLEGVSYSKGSIFVKEVTTFEDDMEIFPAALGLVAMAKRGGNFNTDHAGWEWFEIEPDLSQIIGRGGDYRNNGCNTCHLQANSGGAGADYVFTHPSEFIAQDADFDNYTDWLLIDNRSDTNPLLGGMAHGAGDADSVRKVYKKQSFAKPIDNSPGYPIGTILVKETSLNNTVTEITAMVKRRESADDGSSGWEWFMLDPVDGTIASDESGMSKRGFDLMDGMCTACHSLAHSGDGGGEGGFDFVFPHENDPFYQPAQ